MKEMKRVLALALCFVMLVGMLPVGALAAEAETTVPSETVVETQVAEAAAAAETTEASEETSTETTAAAEPVIETPEADEDLSDLIDEGIVLLSLAIEGIAQTVEALDITEDDLIAAAMETVEGLVDYVAYDIEADMAEGETATVTIPIPEGWDTDNLIVYYVDDNGVVSDETFEGTYDPETRTYSFETTHFSFYVVGYGEQEEEIEVEDPDDATGNTTVGEIETKEVYVLVDSISGAGDYLIVNTNAATASANMLTATANGVTNTGSVTVTAGKDSDGNALTYIENPAAAAIWTASANGTGYRLYNSSTSRYMRYSTSLTTTSSSSSATTWYSGTNTVYKTYSTRYLGFSNNSWTTSSSTQTVYIYQKQTVSIDNTTVIDGTYSIEGDPIEVSAVGVAGKTVTLGSVLTFVPTSGTATTEDVSSKATYTLVAGGDPSGVIAENGISGNTVTLSGAYGTALIKVSYTTALGVVTNYISVVATEPYYSMQLHETIADPDSENGYVVGDEITKTVVLKGEDVGEYGLFPVIKYYDGVAGEDGEDGTEVSAVPAEQIKWESSNENIATVDGLGTVYFTGEEYGTFRVTAYYMAEDGKTILCEDTVTISISESQYTVPGDGTDDFPEYPNEGAVRIDKTAEAVGSFSETGIAKVELSMTGVPYNTGSEVDVVIMVDMSGSMNASNNESKVDRVQPAKDATIAALEALVKNEDGTFNKNRVAVYTFSSSINPNNNDSCDLQEFDVDKLNEMISEDGVIENWSANNGTYYELALEKCQTVLANAKNDGIGNNREQFVIFITDGAPSGEWHYVQDDGTMGNLGDVGSGDEEDVANKNVDEYTEWYSYKMKEAGVEIYSVGVQLFEDVAPTSVSILKGVAGAEDANGVPKTAKDSGFEDYYKFVGTDMSVMDKLLLEIVGQIKQAATNVKVVDKVGENYNMSFKLPNSGVTAEEAGMSEFYIQVVEYTLDENKERTGDPAVKENVTFNADGTVKSHTIDGTACGETCSHVTFSGGVVTAIDGTYFDYNSKEDGEFLSWSEEKLSTTELALQYFAYLDKSAGVDAEDQIEAGTYYTNDYAYVTYTNFQGTECRKDFPQPSMTWNGAQVTYVFYLVNDQGQPVNRAGKVIPFAEAVYVTEPQTFDVTWNQETGTNNMLAENLFASARVPDVYQLYDTNAYYEIRVYQTEGVEQGNDVKNYNYFIIDGSDTGLATYETTKVFNTKAGTKYDDYGVYSAQAKGSTLYTTDADGNASTVTVDYQTTDIDYANTTVAFAVVWQPSLVEDTVVVDFGLDVVVDVITNDAMAAGVTGVMVTAPNAEINSGTYKNAVGALEVTAANGSWTASVESQDSVRFHQNDTQFGDPVDFFYEASVNYYTYGASGSVTANTTNMYSKVTVIPATTVYYEDTFLNLTSFTYSGSNDENGMRIFNEDETSQWVKVGSTIAGALQTVDRPGENKQGSGTYDADNVYGYDGAYDTSYTYSLGSAQKINVNANTRGEATFSFYGTGFDVIGLTSNTTGTLMMQIFEGAGTDGELYVARAVDTYYGYNRFAYEVTYTYTDGEWVETVANIVDSLGTSQAQPQNPAEGATYKIYEYRWTNAPSGDNGLYQVPVMKETGMPYGLYTVKIIAAYGSAFNHTETRGQYDLYLDAIRVYDPTGNEDEVANDAYYKDNEGKPEYRELRDLIIAADSFNKAGDATVSGAVFIDHTTNNYSVADYKNYGPNNELYLDAGQAVAFVLNGIEGIADVQIAMKSANGTPVMVTMSKYATNADGSVNVTSSTAILEEDDTPATDRYYSIGNHIAVGENFLSFRNTGSEGILSITNIKITYSAAAAAKASPEINISQDKANAVVMLLNAEEEETVPEVALDADLQVNIRNKNVKAGSSIVVKATTSADADYLVVNGQKVTKYTESKSTGKRTWTINVKAAAEAGDMDIEVVAYSADGKALETVTETVEVTVKKNGVVQQIVGQLIGMLTR